MEWSDLQHLAVALGVGLLIGVERERRRLELPSDRMLAGVWRALKASIGVLAALTILNLVLGLLDPGGDAPLYLLNRLVTLHWTYAERARLVEQLLADCGSGN